MEFTDKKKQIIREAIRIIHDTCVEHEDNRSCCACPFYHKELECIFVEAPEFWPLSKKPPADWNYFKECEED